MKRFGLGMLWGVTGYLLGAVAGYVLVAQLSGNTHDRGVEAAMTAAFVAGPLAGLVAFVAGFVRAGREGAPPGTRAS